MDEAPAVLSWFSPIRHIFVAGAVSIGMYSCRHPAKSLWSKELAAPWSTGAAALGRESTRHHFWDARSQLEGMKHALVCSHQRRRRSARAKSRGLELWLSSPLLNRRASGSARGNTWLRCDSVSVQG